MERPEARNDAVGASDARDASTRIEPAEAAALFADHAEELRRFLLGLTRDPELSRDLLQSAFARLLERGGEARADRRKAWLFRVAYHEAMLARRVSGRRERGLARWWNRVGRVSGSEGSSSGSGSGPEERLVREETIARVREALDRLPASQARVVRARIREGKTFARIAEEDGEALGTVLARMRLALGKLRRALGDLDPGGDAGNRDRSEAESDSESKPRTSERTRR